MPYKDPIERKQYHARRYARNREKVLHDMRAYYKLNQPNRVAYRAEYRKKHREIINLKKREDFAVNAKKQVAERGVRYRTRLERLAGRPRPAVCEVCKQPPGKKALAFDHNHTTGKFRGWLCTKCNTAIGQTNDNPKLLRKLVTYLENA